MFPYSTLWKQNIATPFLASIQKSLNTTVMFIHVLASKYIYATIKFHIVTVQMYSDSMYNYRKIIF